jgi:DNA/RNA endonuclease YhcR with UshA esterase domain
VPERQPASSLPAAPSAESRAACTDIRNAGPLVGKNACVSGLVLRVYSAHSGNTFLDFCQDYRTCPFSSVIFAADVNKFNDLESWQGKRVEIRGDVVRYQDRAEIIVHDPQQVRLEGQ